VVTCISDYDFTTDLNGTGFLNPYNMKMDRGNCNFDIRHIFNASVVATGAVKSESLLAKVARNWQIAPLVHTQSGAPVNITTGKDNSMAATNTITNFDRPNLMLPGTYTESWRPTLQYLNPATFAQNAPGTFGSLGRNVVRTPDLLSFDVSVDRLFTLAERIHLDLRRRVQCDQPHQLRWSDPERRSDSRHRRRRERSSDVYHLWPDHVRRRPANHAVVNEAGVLARRSGRP
jgi:hypothetical protein